MPRCSTLRMVAGRGVDLTILPVERDGLVDLDALEATRRARALVAVMLVNNEIGAIQPIAEIAALAHRPAR